VLNIFCNLLATGPSIPSFLTQIELCVRTAFPSSEYIKGRYKYITNKSSSKVLVGPMKTRLGQSRYKVDTMSMGPGHPSIHMKPTAMTFQL
jgi:hypothetical protein